MAEKRKTTQRAYTLRLHGEGREDTSWRDALWRTHEAVNLGAWVFGDWLLTLRGGLSHELADEPIPGEEGQNSRQPTDDERRNRRILLALSWLSVESKRGAPEAFIIASGSTAGEERTLKVVETLRSILSDREVAPGNAEAWISDCTPTLSAAIRDDAVWVNRSMAFDVAVKNIGPTLTRAEVWDVLEPFLGDWRAYSVPVNGGGDDALDGGEEDTTKDLVQKAGQWLSSRFGTGQGADFDRMELVYKQIEMWESKPAAGTSGKNTLARLANELSGFDPVSMDLAGVLRLISGPGYKSATRNLLKKLDGSPTVSSDDLNKLKEVAASDYKKCAPKKGKKGERAYADAILRAAENRCGFTYLQEDGGARHSQFAVILDHAARRVSTTHTWIKRAEAERRRFDEEASGLSRVSDAAREWLDSYCRERSERSGSLEPYRIRRRAIGGWEEVFRTWTGGSCQTTADRVAEARRLQSDPEIEKFGDIQLFEALAEEDAFCVWRNCQNTGHGADPQPLLNYAIAKEAEYKKQKFKVPAYRHPDALRHPVFCDFGNSRWDIRFRVHRDRRTAEPDVVSMSLWTGTEIREVDLYWQSKRLTRNLDLGSNGGRTDAIEVSRADRLGRAAAGADEANAVEIAGLFEEKHWNGRLQAPRRYLDRIAALRDGPAHAVETPDQRWRRLEKFERLKRRIPWLVTFSAKLQPKGPWQEFAEGQQLHADPKKWAHSEINKSRGAQAKLILSRLPGLRVLSVDLGHRYAAACAVWETLSSEQLVNACKVSGHRAPREQDLYLHLKKSEGRLKRSGASARMVEAEKTVIYRRIGADCLPDGSRHPAPWARLDRQFLIKLQGEETCARKASNDEIWDVHEMEAGVGRAAPLIDRLAAAGWAESSKAKPGNRMEAMNHWRQRGWQPTAGTPSGREANPEGWRGEALSVDELMLSAVRTLRIGLQRHAERARIARSLIADEKELPGGRTEPLDENGRIELLQDTLLRWHGLFSARHWEDPAAEELWRMRIAALAGYQALEPDAEDAARAARSKTRAKNLQQLRGVAEALAGDFQLRKELGTAWRRRWEADDVGWTKRLRCFRDWVFPRGKGARNAAIRGAGGLSLTRLATITEFRRKVQVGFYTRQRPDGTRAVMPERFGQKSLDTLDHLREQRVKQLASRIAEAALGVGRVRRQDAKDPKRPCERVDAPCHAVVIENLRHYRPEETRTRRENRQLMTWASSKVGKYLTEACELHGLHLRETPAAYTSRQDSRTGAPGLRCRDVPILEFLHSPFWRRQVEAAGEKQACDDSRARFLLRLHDHCRRMERAGRANATIRVPDRGGEIFVSADVASPAARGLQADLNAAANIGLAALLDPDWPGKWWRVPCDANGLPIPEKVKGCAAAGKTKTPLPGATAVREATVAAGKSRKAKGQQESAKGIANLWRDISGLPIDSKDPGEWLGYKAYSRTVEERVMQVLQRPNRAPDEDVTPF